MKSLFPILLLIQTLVPLSGHTQGLKKRMEKTFTTYFQTVSVEPQTLQLRTDLKDSINSWLEKKLKYVLFLDRTDWQVDSAVFYNGDRTRALLIILFQPRDPGYRYDYAKTIAAEKLNDGWHFYYVSLPLLLNDRKNGEKVSFPALAADSRFQIWSDGFIYCEPGCKINYQYLDSDVWITGWRREQHTRFLNNALPEIPSEKAETIPH